MRTHYLILVLLIVTLGALMSCGAEQPVEVEAQPGKPLAPAVQAEERFAVTNSGRTSGPYATVVTLKNGSELVAFGYYSSPERTVIISAEPGQPARLLYPLPPPTPVLNPPVTLLPVVTNTNTSK